jgi:2-polyprenyl-3-methyl-5-hydroxy-6-metoxy-1,4-benzoquinol methylase
MTLTPATQDTLSEEKRPRHSSDTSDLTRKVLDLYRPQGLKAYLYTQIRWRLCPFLTIAKHIPDEARVLEVGCGVGMLSNLLHLRNDTTTVVGVDLNADRIKSASATIGARSGIAFHHGNALAIAAQYPFDTITMTDFLHHLTYEEQEDLLDQLIDKLPENGRLIILDIVETPKWKHAFADRIDRLLNHGQISLFRSRENWIDLLARKGLKVSTETADKRLPLSVMIFNASK